MVEMVVNAVVKQILLSSVMITSMKNIVTDEACDEPSSE